MLLTLKLRTQDLLLVLTAHGSGLEADGGRTFTEADWLAPPLLVVAAALRHGPSKQNDSSCCGQPLSSVVRVVPGSPDRSLGLRGEGRGGEKGKVA